MDYGPYPQDQNLCNQSNHPKSVMLKERSDPLFLPHPLQIQQIKRILTDAGDIALVKIDQFIIVKDHHRGLLHHDIIHLAVNGITLLVISNLVGLFEQPLLWY